MLNLFSAEKTTLFHLIRKAVPLFLCGTALSAAEVAVDRLNLRLEPSRDSVPAGTVPRGTKLHVISEKDGWAAVTVPKDIPVWISSSFIKDGRSTKDARLRSGPGVFHPQYTGKIPENTELKILERSENGYWFRIEPPPQLICYVSSRYLTGYLENTAERRAEESNSVSSEPHPASIEGKLIPLTPPVNGANYKLILEINGKIIPLCYLHTRSLNLKLWENRIIRVEGMQRWIGNIKLPFIEIEKVSPSWK